MPEPAAELTLYCFEQAKQRAAEANEIVEECGFYPSVVEGSKMDIGDYRLYMYEPFEDRDENIELLEDCVQSLNKKFDEMEVWCLSQTNSDHGNPVSFDYHIYIAPDREIEL